MKRIKYSEQEMVYSKEYPSIFPGESGWPCFHSPVSPRQNYQILLSDDKPLWMPLCTELLFFSPSIIPENIARANVMESEEFDPSKYGGKDFFGVIWEYRPESMGSMVRPGNPVLTDVSEWKEQIHFPDLNSYDWAGCAERNADYLNDGRLKTMVVYTGFFERLVSFMDMSEALITMIDEDAAPDLNDLFSNLADFYIKYINLCKKWFQVDHIVLHDDWGAQRGPLFSPGICQARIIPHLKKVVAATHKLGLSFELHSCGKIDSMVPLMIDAGVDAWSGQSMNDKDTLYKLYGDKIHLGISPPLLPANASADEYAKAAIEFVRKYPSGTVYVAPQFGMQQKMNVEIYRQSRILFN
ncbi:MAG: methyltransferase [Parasporobacterium sp.]|nr:methyltransferase [Parasporobacterium sp.]